MYLNLYQQPHRYKASMSGHVTTWLLLPQPPGSTLAQVDISAWFLTRSLLFFLGLKLVASHSIFPWLQGTWLHRYLQTSSLVLLGEHASTVSF